MNVEITVNRLPSSDQARIATYLCSLANDAVIMDDPASLSTIRLLTELMLPYLSDRGAAIFKQLQAYIEMCETLINEAAGDTGTEEQEALLAALKQSIDELSSSIDD